MPLTVEDIPQKRLLCRESVNLVLQHKRQSRREKGKHLYCLVSDSREHNYHSEQSDLLMDLKRLKKMDGNGKIPAGTRIQLLVQSGVHWTAVDILFSEEMSAIILDASGDKRWQITLRALCRVFPDITIFASIGGIQYDGENCAIFALDHIFNISKIIDIHEHYKANMEKYVEKTDTFFHCYLKLELHHLPPTLVTNMQRVGNFEQYYFNKNACLSDIPLGDKQQPLTAIIQENTQQLERYTTNTRIHTKKEKYKEKIIEQLTTNNEGANNSSFRSRFFKILKSKKTTSSYDKYTINDLMSSSSNLRFSSVN